MRVLLAFGLLAAPAALALGVCSGKWQGKVCGNEAYTLAISTTEYVVSASAGEPPAVSVLRPALDGEVVDLDISAWTNAGDGAVVGVLDLELLLLRKPELIADPDVITACAGGLDSDCLLAFKSRVSTDDLSASALWGHGCQKASDTRFKLLTGITLDPPISPILKVLGARYLLVATADGGSSARMKVVVKHNTPRQLTARVCGSVQSGPFPTGSTVGTTLALGDFKVDAKPQHGGTLGPLWLAVNAPNARGTFQLSSLAPNSTAQLSFQGDTDECPKLNATFIPNNRIPFWVRTPLSLYPQSWEQIACGQVRWIPDPAKKKTEHRCFRASHWRPASPLSQCPGTERDGALCYVACKPGFHGAGPLCWQDCKPGFVDDGATCRKDAAIVSADNSKCPGYDVCGLSFARGCSKCPDGFANDGCLCRRDPSIELKESYGRGGGSSMICNPQEQQLGALCYGGCERGFKADGVWCVAEQETCADVPVDEPPDYSKLQTFHFKGRAGGFCSVYSQDAESASQALEWIKCQCANCTWEQTTNLASCQ